MVAGQVPSGEGKDELLRLFLQAARGLSALHERSLVHFDIKPANVFLKGSVARLGDYGLSKLVTHSRGSLSMGRGTPYYMAPELLQRRGDHRSDVYSLGVMLYELLCGALPFTGDNEWEVLKKHETAPPVLPTHLSERERAILSRCLAKDPAARFQSVGDLIAAFGATAGVVPTAASEAALAPAPVLPPAAAARPAEPPPLPADLPDERPAPPPRRRPIIRPAPPVGVFRRAIPIAVAVGVALFLFSMRGSRPRPQFDFPDVQVVDASATPPPAAPPDRPSPRGSGRRRGTTTTSSATPFEQQVQNVAKNARTAAQLYSGEADWTAIATLKQHVRSIPVLGNGDVFEAWDALRMLRQTGCDGVVVGRGCLGRPWLFGELCAALTGQEPPPPPDLGGVVDAMREHGRLLATFFGEKNGMQQVRKFTGWYLKGFPSTKRLLPALHMVKTLAEFEALLAELPRDVAFPEVALRARRCKDGSTQTVSLPEGFLTARDEDLQVEDPAEMDGG
jgi:hypothetical protein